MVFACQTDSFLRTFTTKVTSCERVKDDNSYEIICEDTILFPEGGGQPFDTGFLNEIPVYQVLRRGAHAVHFVKTPLPVGSEVNQKLDWERRFDHMQQHSGQHLITAIINAAYKIDTTSWWLGTDVSHIELATNSLTQHQIANIEKLTNEKITEQVPVIVKLSSISDPSLNGAHTRGLPADVAGPIRVVEIVGMEDNLCCGTHVTNLVQLQAVKLLYAEKGKKNKINLFFLSGGRVLKYLTNALQREQKLTKLLNNEPSQHADLVEKLQVNVKTATKKLTGALKQLAVFESNILLRMTPRPPYYFHHSKDGDKEYADTFLRVIKGDESSEKTLIVLTFGEDKGAGNLLVHGDAALVATLGPRIAEHLGGKGAAHGTTFQAKVSKLGNLKDAVMLVKETFENVTGKMNDQ